MICGMSEARAPTDWKLNPPEMSDNLYILDILMIQNVFLLWEKQCKYVYSPKNPADLLTMSATNTKTQKHKHKLQYSTHGFHYMKLISTTITKSLL